MGLKLEDRSPKFNRRAIAILRQAQYSSRVAFGGRNKNIVSVLIYRTL